ncbi:acyl-CoA thioesterase [Thalassotalea mangrovi]|uniref:Acyl-CoA thioesterase n=1 Tax=Thalassotalea mangrovi TaxID=2572245 RepID=A0A4U1B947_9GAMM|nr:acyl-CoA thioesterase [Thalassotalea mangrovi]TKB47173.1 acyl-CoA thioesterase [Thalassotalea mangrovi]
MNLYFRFFSMMLTSWFKSAIDIFAPFTTRHIVWPSDLDLLGHINNGRYFTITDNVRVEMMIRAGLWQAIRKEKFYPVIAGETAQFRKPLLPFQRYEIVTRFSGWDDKFLYVEHTFKSKRGVHALLMVKIRIISDSARRISPKEMLDLIPDADVDAINVCHIVDKWNESSLNHWQQLES